MLQPTSDLFHQRGKLEIHNPAAIIGMTFRNFNTSMRSHFYYKVNLAIKQSSLNEHNSVLYNFMESAQRSKFFIKLKHMQSALWPYKWTCSAEGRRRSFPGITKYSLCVMYNII